MDTLIFVPRRSTRGRAKFAVLKAEFQRYQQRAADGPDSAKFRDWTLVYGPATKAELIAVYNFFVAQGGYKKFLWTEPFPFDDAPRAFFNGAPEWSYDGGDVVSLTVEIEGVPAL